MPSFSSIFLVHVHTRHNKITWQDQRCFFSLLIRSLRDVSRQQVLTPQKKESQNSWVDLIHTGKKLTKEYDCTIRWCNQIKVNTTASEKYGMFTTLVHIEHTRKNKTNVAPNFFSSHFSVSSLNLNLLIFWLFLPISLRVFSFYRRGLWV